MGVIPSVTIAVSMGAPCGGLFDRNTDNMRSDHGEGKREPLKEHAFEPSPRDTSVRLPIRMAALGDPLPEGAEAFLPPTKTRARRSRDMFDEEESSARSEHAQDFAKGALRVRYCAQYVRAHHNIHAFIFKRKLFGPPSDERRPHAEPFGLSPQVAMHKGIRFNPHPSDVRGIVSEIRSGPGSDLQNPSAKSGKQSLLIRPQMSIDIRAHVCHHPCVPSLPQESV